MSGQQAADEQGPRFHDECYACPVGSVFVTLQGAQPDATEHLLNAVQELVQVARSFLDAADAVVEHQRQARHRAGDTPRVRRIVVD